MTKTLVKFVLSFQNFGKKIACAVRHNRIQTVLQYGCVPLRMRFFPQNFGTIKRILPGSSSPSHREGPGTEVALLIKSFRQDCRKLWRHFYWGTLSSVLYIFCHADKSWKNEPPFLKKSYYSHFLGGDCNKEGVIVSQSECEKFNSRLNFLLKPIELNVSIILTFFVQFPRGTCRQVHNAGLGFINLLLIVLW